MTCPATGIKDFPIQTNVPVTQLLNQSIFEPSTLDIQWAQRGTVPAFEQNALTEGVLNSAAQTTTLRLRGSSYTLKLVKLAEPQHKSFLRSTDQPRCTAEVVFLFESPSALVEKFVFLCIPVLNQSSTSPSPYLESIRQDRLPGRPISLRDLLPQSKRYTSYTTCLHQVTAGKTRPVQASVMVFTQGLSYPQSSLREILKKLPGSPTAAPPLGSLVDGLVAKTNLTPFLVTTEADYKNFLRVSDLSESGGAGNRRVDSTDSYKCVPLNPDTTVKNNRIIIDTDKGVPLSQILQEKKEDEGDAKITPGMVERMIATLLGTAAGIFILSILAYLVSRVTSDTSDPQWVWVLSQTRTLLPMVFVSMVVGIIGFLIGFFTSTS